MRIGKEYENLCKVRERLTSADEEMERLLLVVAVYHLQLLHTGFEKIAEKVWR
jgi:hypothetical protein